jgi:uncharacterized protein (DUF362 family)/NAD-dependent dihydropyrimidine dehydrogenase PreA subunit
MMAKSVVSLIPCTTYDPAAVHEAVKAAVDLLGGAGAFVSPEEKVVLKPNVLNGADPSKAVTTHPSVLEAAVRLFREHGNREVTYGDSSGGRAADWKKNLETCGLKETGDRLGVPMGDFGNPVRVHFAEGTVCRDFVLCKEVTSGVLVSLCKMKTHALTRITGAVKNQYGCVCGAHKAAGHAHYPSSETFAGMLCDLNRLVKPRLFIMDGIMAMEGNGPGNGDPVPMNLILASADPVALDTVFSCLVHLEPSLVQTCVAGAGQGLGVMAAGSISVLTAEGAISVEEAVERYGKEDFRVNRTASKKGGILRRLGIGRKYPNRPVVDPEKCVACGKCEEVCPVEGKAVRSGNGKKAVHDYSKCIRCYCCQEMCPVSAITREER